MCLIFGTNSGQTPPDGNYDSFRFVSQGMDFRSNAKTNDANINDFLYSGDEPVGSGYQLPSDPGSGAAFMRQPMNRPESASQGGALAGATNANDKIAMLKKHQQL